MYRHHFTTELLLSGCSPPYALCHLTSPFRVKAISLAETETMLPPSSTSLSCTLSILGLFVDLKYVCKPQPAHAFRLVWPFCS